MIWLLLKKNKNKKTNKQKKWRNKSRNQISGIFKVVVMKDKDRELKTK